MFLYLKSNTLLVSLDLSWSKIPITIVANDLFPALEKNKTLSYLNLSHIKMSSMVIEIPFKKLFCKFIKEN